MTASGLSGQVMIAKETTFGTYAAPTLGPEFISESLKFERERIESEGIRKDRRTTHRWAQGVQRVAGDLETELPNVGPIGRLWWLGFGGYTFQSGVPEVGANTHTYTPGLLKGKSVTAQVGRPDIGATVRPFSLVGCKVTEWELSATVNEYAKATFSIYGVHEDRSQALATAAYPSALSPFVFTQGLFKIAGANYDVKEVNAAATLGLEVDRHQIRATTPERSKEPEESELREYTSEITSDFIDLTAYERFVNGTEASLSLKFTGGLIGATATPYSFEITGNVRFDGETPEIGGRELLEQPLQAKFVSSTSDAAAITAILINDDATYA